MRFIPSTTSLSSFPGAIRSHGRHLNEPQILGRRGQDLNALGIREHFHLFFRRKNENLKEAI